MSTTTSLSNVRNDTLATELYLNLLLEDDNDDATHLNATIQYHAHLSGSKTSSRAGGHHHFSSVPTDSTKPEHTILVKPRWFSNGSISGFSILIYFLR
jgi:hypothetical protein